MNEDKLVCEKTISGNHLWVNRGYAVSTRPGYLSDDSPKYCWKCEACGMIDDRALDAETRKDEQARND